MESRAALGAAAALALTVTGGVSALFLAVGQASGAETPATDSAVTVEYVDQYGNPVAPAAIDGAATSPEVILVNPDGSIVDQSAEGMEPAMADAAYGEEAEAYEEGEDYEEDEAEEHEEGEAHEEDEAHEADEYAAGEHVEDEDYDETEEHEDD